MTLLAARSLSRDYGVVRVVADVDVDFRPGSIHALLGENGAGKSTLIKMLAGVVRPSAGEILIDGAPREFRGVADAQAAGIVALPQELVLVGGLDSAENIFLGMSRPGRRGMVDRRRLRHDALEAVGRLGQSFPVDVPVRELSAVQQTMVALARALVRDARVLFLDEPTAALTASETVQLFDVLRVLRDQGTAIGYVSHRLEEVFELADEATVMRNGQVVWTRRIADTTPADVVTAMIGRRQEEVFPPRAAGPGATVLSVRDLRGHTVDGVTLDVAAGRVLGVGGLAGSGRSELLKLIAGAEKARGGAVALDGRDITTRPLARRMADGVAFVPEERRSQGLVMRHSIAQNIGLASLRANSRAGVVDGRRERTQAQARVDELRIRTTGVAQGVDELSGGNQQKVVLAKYLERRPRVLLLDEPTKGIDVGTKAELYQLIRQQADAGVAVVVVSSEIPELLGLADDIAVLHEGRLAGIVDAANADESTILSLAYREDL